jgi:hypothetical protein
MDKVERVLDGSAKKIAKDPTDWRCKFCFKKSVCWDKVEIAPECSKCQYAMAKANGLWHCLKRDEEAVSPCDEFAVYEPLPRD